MKRSDIIPGLLDAAPAFICKDLNAKDEQIEYRVPLKHINLPRTFGEQPDAATAQAAISDLPAFPNIDQFRTVFQDGNGLGLFLPIARQDSGHPGEDSSPDQDLFGSIVLFPSHEWVGELDAMSDWFSDGADDVFDELPYTFEDILPFAGVNYSPDRWYVVLRGPMAGAICWWTHDGDSAMDTPWAIDLKAWAERVWAELPDIFGGIIRFAAIDAVGPCPQDAELYPERFVRDVRTDR